MPIPFEITRQRYISLITFRKNGSPVPTPVWFGEENDRLYVMTRSISGKIKRIRNSPQVRIAPCTIRGRITGPEFAATARILPQESWVSAKKTITRKYAMARLPLLWRRIDAYLEIGVAA